MKLKETEFDGLKSIELTTNKIRLIAVYEYGPRIAFWGPNQTENLLLWKPGAFIHKKWDLRGGHRVWVTRPGADESEETYFPDNQPADVEKLQNGFCLTGAEDDLNNTRRGFKVCVIDENKIEVDNFVINCGKMLYSTGVWAITCTVPGKDTTYEIPLGDDSSWDCFNMIMFRTWAGHGKGGYNDQQFTFNENTLIVQPRGIENKRMLQAPKGTITMVDPKRNLTFTKKVNYNPTGQYPKNTNLAIYIGPDNFMVEMETMGEEISLKPGNSAHNVETWTLIN